MDHEIKLYSNRTGVAAFLLYFVLTLILFFLGLPLLAAALSPPGGDDSLLIKLTIFIAVSLYAFLITGLSMHMVHALRFAKKPVLTFNGMGINDNTRALAVGFIRWGEIEEIFRCEFYSSGAAPSPKKENGIAIRFRNRDNFLSRQSLLTRTMIRLKSGPGYFIISTANLGLSAVELDNLIGKIGKMFYVKIGSPVVAGRLDRR